MEDKKGAYERRTDVGIVHIYCKNKKERDRERERKTEFRWARMNERQRKKRWSAKEYGSDLLRKLYNALSGVYGRSQLWHVIPMMMMLLNLIVSMRWNMEICSVSCGR